ncbi:hypothetical protein HZB03_03470 [Candidatus Woesearchaeota archaeon]|nr:hypothetical protein [Candidatus Woesearchaeota archaeon]
MDSGVFKKTVIKTVIYTIGIGTAAAIGALVGMKIALYKEPTAIEPENHNIPVLGALFSYMDDKELKAYTEQFKASMNVGGGQRFTDLQIRRFYQLKLSPDEVLHFHDTEKPNALLIYPSADGNGAFYDVSSQKFLANVKEKYDVGVLVATVEQEVYAAIDEIPTIELLVLSGHGTKDSLRLGERNPAEQKHANYRNEEFMIDLYDWKLLKHLDKLSPNATIFLNSCSTATGGKEADNLANFVSFAASRRKVIASKEDFKTQEINVVSRYPLELKIEVDGKDATYYSK